MFYISTRSQQKLYDNQSTIMSQFHIPHMAMGQNLWITIWLGVYSKEYTSINKGTPVLTHHHIIIIIPEMVYIHIN